MYPRIVAISATESCRKNSHHTQILSLPLIQKAKMKSPRIPDLKLDLRTLSLLVLSGCTLLSGCATTGSSGNGANVTASDKTRMTKSGFLSDYAQLKPAAVGDGLECWRAPNLNARNYDKAMFSRIVVSLAPPKGSEEQEMIDPSDLKTLTDYFHGAMVKAMKPQMPVVDQAGAGVVVIRIALTNLVPTKVSRSVGGTLIPFGFVAEAGSGVATGRPAGSTPYLGETSMEMQFLDGASGKVLAECRDTQIGRKYAAEVNSGADGAATTWANGYLNSFQAWSYAKNAFDKWSLLVAQRMGQLRGTEQVAK